VRADGRGARALLVLAVVLAYANAVGASFQFDDFNVIVNNPMVHSWAAWWSGMPGIRPLLKVSYTANWTSGLGVAGFHVLNIALHATNALLVFALVRRLAPRLVVDAPAAFFTALVFALHPAQTEAVTYVSGRSTALMAAFSLLAALAHLRANEAGARRRAGDRVAVLAWRAFSGLAFLCALAVKEHAWALPGLLLLCERLDASVRWRSSLARLWPHAVVLACAFAITLVVPSYWRLLGASLDTRSLGDNLLTQIDGVFHLFTGPLAGVGLNIDPDLPVRTAWTIDLVAKAALLVALPAIAVVQWRRRPWLGFGIAWCFVALLPTNSVLPRADVVNDRHLYLALVGPALVVAGFATRLPRTSWIAVAAAIALLLGAATALRNRDYATEVALWEATARTSPDKARVWNNLGWAWQQAGRIDDAKRAYDRAIELDPDFWKARLNRGALEP
jgi:tetratricopeptide (TPR) repeat protein